MTLSWPKANLAPKSISVDLSPRPVGGVPSITGGMQWLQSDAGCWLITYSGVELMNATNIKLFRALARLLNGPGTPIMVPVFEMDDRVPWPTSGGVQVTKYNPVLHSDSTYFSDGSGYYQPVIDAYAAAAPLRATSLTVTWNYGGTLVGGEFFSIDEGLYQIATVVQTSAGPPVIYQITFLPPLRAALGASTALNFDDPRARCILSGTTDMTHDLQSGVFAEPNVNWIEDFPL